MHRRCGCAFRPGVGVAIALPRASTTVCTSCTTSSKEKVKTSGSALATTTPAGVWRQMGQRTSRCEKFMMQCVWKRCPHPGSAAHGAWQSGSVQMAHSSSSI